jgi:TPR repeat protein
MRQQVVGSAHPMMVIASSSVALLISGCGASQTPRQHCGTANAQKIQLRRQSARCEEAHSNACVEAGRIYEMGGYFVPRSPREAARFYARGCRQRHARACKDLSRLLT